MPETSFGAIAGIDLLDGRAPIRLPVGHTTQLLEWCAAHRVEGLVASALQHGRLHVDGSDADKTMETFAEQYHAALRTCLLAEETAVRCVAALSAAGIDNRILKGVALSHLDYANPSQRVFGDADILIGRHRLDDAIRVLRRVGMVRESPPVRRWWERRYGKALVLIGAGDRELDLHIALTDGFFGTTFESSSTTWHAETESFVLGGVRMRALPAQHRLLHACFHAELGNRSGVRTLRDVAQLIIVRGTDWQAVVETASRSRADAVVAAAIRRAWSTLDLGELDDHPAHVWAVAHEPTVEQATALRSYAIARTSGWVAEGRGTLPALPSRRDRGLYLAGLIWPSRANLRSRSVSGVTRCQHLGGLARSWVDRR